MDSRHTASNNGEKRSFLCFMNCILIVFFVLLIIVNNGKILTDGSDERKYLQRKYNEL